MLFGEVPSESVANKVVTVVPMGVSSSRVIGFGTMVNIGGTSFTSCKEVNKYIITYLGESLKFELKMLKLS